MLAFIFDLQSFIIITFPIADFAFDPHIGKEVHLDSFQPTSLACFTTSVFDIKAKSTRFVPPHLGFRKLSVELAYFIEQFGVSRWIRARRPTNRRLTDVDDFVEIFNASDSIMRSSPLSTCGEGKGVRCVRAHQFSIESLEKNIVDERAFARTRNARHTGEQPDGNFNVDIFQIIMFRADDFYPFFIYRSASFRYWNLLFAAKILSRQRMFIFTDFTRRPRYHNLPAVDARTRSKIDYVIS